MLVSTAALLAVLRGVALDRPLAFATPHTPGTKEIVGDQAG